ncbi:hypothetical protein GCM10023147_03990 [Tsukamurella soli]|uniref:Uncharacterized protein n=2 Tax=Tsukamurella soli TaxID=644556 RepID=A0ABP8J2V7_9ACTN
MAPEGGEASQMPRLPALRVLWARWCVLSAAGCALGGAPLPFTVSVDGPVARYRASSTAGAMLARFGSDRAVLSCGDYGWRVPGASAASGLIAGGPAWADHGSMIDHHVRAEHFGWAAYWDVDGWRAPPVPTGIPLPPAATTASVALALAAAQGGGNAQRDNMFHVARMAEYQWLDEGSWRAAFDGDPAGVTWRAGIDEGWRLLDEQALTTSTGTGPVTADVDGRTASAAVALAVEYAEQRRIAVPPDVRVDSAFRRESGWEIRFSDYRDENPPRRAAILVADNGWVGRSPATPLAVTGTTRTPGPASAPLSGPG